MKRLLSSLAIIGTLLMAAACQKPADIASRNLSVAADNFEISRRVIFYNGITDSYMLTIEGLCSLGNFDTGNKLSVTCRTGPKTYKKHYLGLSDNVTFFVEQLEGSDVSSYHYRVVFRPQSILPDIDIQTDVEELNTDRH